MAVPSLESGLSEGAGRGAVWKSYSHEGTGERERRWEGGREIERERERERVSESERERGRKSMYVHNLGPGTEKVSC